MLQYDRKVDLERFDDPSSWFDFQYAGRRYATVYATTWFWIWHLRTQNNNRWLLGLAGKWFRVLAVSYIAFFRTCKYNGFCINEEEVLDECGSKPIPLAKAEFLANVIRAFPFRCFLFESRCKEVAPGRKIIREKGDPVKEKLRGLQRVCRHKRKAKSVIVTDERREYQHFCADCGWFNVFVRDWHF